MQAIIFSDCQAKMALIQKMALLQCSSKQKAYYIFLSLTTLNEVLMGEFPLLILAMLT